MNACSMFKSAKTRVMKAISPCVIVCLSSEVYQHVMSEAIFPAIHFVFHECKSWKQFSRWRRSSRHIKCQDMCHWRCSACNDWSKFPSEVYQHVMSEAIFPAIHFVFHECMFHVWVILVSWMHVPCLSLPKPGYGKYVGNPVLHLSCYVSGRRVRPGD